MNAGLVVWGESGSSSLTRREDFARYHLQVQWSEANRWRETAVSLPDGRAVSIDQYVGENFRRPRQYHPEYALAIELLIANAVVEAKARGFRVSSVELGLWPYMTLTQLGKRVTTVGLQQPMLRLDGRTETLIGHQWVDHEGEGVLLVPWANGDQLIRLKDSRGYYVVPVDERTADASTCPQASDWKAVQSYPQLDFEGGLAWADVPLLEAADPMVELLECEQCLNLHPVKPWSFGRDLITRKRVCGSCRDELKRVRAEAREQGWDFDKGQRLPPPPKRPRYVQRLVNPAKCTHKWGMQMAGTSNAALAPEKRETEGMKTFRVCIICGAPDPRYLPKTKTKKD